MKLPCIEDKCILLPICKSKFEIECMEITKYYAFETDGSYNNADRAWDEIEKVLPKLIKINGPMVRSPCLTYRSYNIHKYPPLAALSVAPGYPKCMIVQVV
jgi:hypothetical protein